MSSKGRIWFHDNPWPNGHAVSEFAWSGRLDQTGRLWFDLHLETVDYESEGPAAVDLDDDWHSTIVWTNYHSCTLSSTNWADEGSTGFLVGSEKSPLKWSELPKRVLQADPTSEGEDYDFDTHHSFLIYLTGHDGVADHHLAVRPAECATFDLEWTGRIALVYGGDMRLTHTFLAKLAAARFGGFVIDRHLSDEEAWALFRKSCTDADRFEIVSSDRSKRVFQLQGES